MMTEGEKNALQKALADEDYFESAMSRSLQSSESELRGITNWKRRDGERTNPSGPQKEE